MVKKIIPEKSKTEKNSKKAPENNLAKLIKDLKKCDNMKYSPEKNELLQKIRNKIIAIGTPAVLPMIKILEDQEDPSWESAAYIAGELHDERAIMPLINAIENHDLKITANEQLIKFGPDVVPEVIKRVENRIANPIKEGIGASNMTGSALLTIGEIHCGESIEFLNTLLDEYMSEMPDESFDLENVTGNM